MRDLVDILLQAPLFRDRAEAGRALAAVLPDLGRQTVVVGLARGGVPVGAEIAATHGWSLDVVAVRKVRHPDQPEYALGAVVPFGDGIYLRDSGEIAGDRLVAAVDEARREARALDRRLHSEHGPVDVTGHTVVLVDDGLATGATMIAAARWAAARTARTVAAVPVAACQSVPRLRDEVDEVVCPHVRDDLYAIGFWYADFAQVTDEDVLRLLADARERSHPPPA